MGAQPAQGNTDLVQLGGISLEPINVHPIINRLKKVDDHWRVSQFREACLTRLPGG